MLYLMVFVFNYLAIGGGIWVAIRHEELLRRETMHPAIGQIQKRLDPLEITPKDTQYDADSHPLESQENQTVTVGNVSQNVMDGSDDSVAGHSDIIDGAGETIDAASETIGAASETIGSVGETKNSILSDLPVSSGINESAIQPSLETNSEEERLTANDRVRLDRDRLSVDKPLFAEEMYEIIEQLVGMREDDELKEMASLITQIQEINDMVAVANHHYFVSEDADCFVTPDNQQYATTTFCRPIVGRKNKE